MIKKLFYPIQKLDQWISYWMINHQSQSLSHMMRFISTLGNGGFIWLMIVVGLFIIKDQTFGFNLLTSLMLATLSGQVIIKSIVGRKRPCHIDPNINMVVKVPDDSSFPSGHTTSSFACATYIFLCHPIAGIFALVFAGLMGFSRIYLYVHYFSDVLAGIVLGTLVGHFVFIFL